MSVCYAGLVIHQFALEERLIAMEKASGSQRLFFVSALNVVASFAVVLLHCSLQVFSPSPTKSWLLAEITQACAIFAVPIFFMISGMNLLNYRKRYTTLVFFKKRFLRVGITLLSASLLVYMLYILFPQWFYQGYSYADNAGLFDFIKRFATNNICDVYWFLYAIIYLYLLTPLLSLIANHKRCMQYLLGVTFCISVLVPLMQWFGLPSQYVTTLFNWPFFASINMFYFILGFYIKNYGIPLGIFAKLFVTAKMCFFIFVVITLLTIMMGLWSNNYWGGVTDVYDSYWVGITSPLCVLQAVALFALLMNLEQFLQRRSTGFLKVMNSLSASALYVYLFHMLFINIQLTGIAGDIYLLLGKIPIIKAVIVYILTVCIILFVRGLFQKLRHR